MKVRRLLRTPPDAGSKQLAMWHKMKRLTVEQFEYYWQLVEKHNPMFEFKKIKYTAWDPNHWTGLLFKYEGLRHRHDGEAHGIIRVVNPDGDIIEYTCREGKSHGLFRWIKEKLVIVWLKKAGQNVAMLEFSHDFEEKCGHDSKGLLQMSPYSLKL